ncbi:isochorismate lyase [Vibrio vulnificus]|uniref:chorismate mutase n=4 Tax=Vibrio vulnificus TaxID=672 RepID=A0A087IXM6_VIBVL|nr:MULTISPECIES: isochorismate lyase [Vibrio]EWS68776.1 isochorismate-pyruvate lyase [Vibrio vulnificus BAA87]OJI58249.1 Salicylate biosynthesis protein PchB [Vibrio fluvialis]AAO07762.1 Isochorismate pyruvate-lyase of siderophore biosynthesis Vulnibactin-specific [Vibrio vulnificus CMCP6]ADV89229.1 isochorismate pyruvate-lyase of siderophore biosynthesis [Vibrio vulnificus MO6-24/O]AIL73279.1 isochorismate-pyruvate lyase [Vibrio vulnificus]
MASLKKPEACESLNDIRLGIDTLDKEIVHILSQRMGYVKAAAQFKPDEKSIPAPERVASMLEERRHWANEQGLSEEYVEALFDNIIQWYISQQIQHWRSQKGLAPVSQD